MKINMLALMVGVAMVSVSSAFAQETTEKPIPPAGRLLNPPGNFSAWEINYSYGKGKKNPADPQSSDTPETVPMTLPSSETSKIRRVRLTVTKPKWHLEIIDSANKKSDLWFDGNIMYTEDRGGPVTIPREAFEMQLVALDASGFPDLAWVDSTSFIGPQNFGGVDYLVFQGASNKMAWITADKRLPAIWRQGDETRRFRELPSPTQMLKMPSAIERESEITKATIEARKRPSLQIAK